MVKVKEVLLSTFALGLLTTGVVQPVSASASTNSDSSYDYLVDFGESELENDVSDGIDGVRFDKGTPKSVKDKYHSTNFSAFRDAKYSHSVPNLKYTDEKIKNPTGSEALKVKYYISNKTPIGFKAYGYKGYTQGKPYTGPVADTDIGGGVFEHNIVLSPEYGVVPYIYRDVLNKKLLYAYGDKAKADQLFSQSTQGRIYVDLVSKYYNVESYNEFIGNTMYTPSAKTTDHFYRIFKDNGTTQKAVKTVTLPNSLKTARLVKIDSRDTTSPIPTKFVKGVGYVEVLNSKGKNVYVKANLYKGASNYKHRLSNELKGVAINGYQFKDGLLLFDGKPASGTIFIAKERKTGTNKTDFQDYYYSLTKNKKDKDLTVSIAELIIKNKVYGDIKNKRNADNIALQFQNGKLVGSGNAKLSSNGNFILEY